MVACGGHPADSGGTVSRSGGSVPHSTPGAVPILGAGVVGVPDMAFRWDRWILTLRLLGGILTPGRYAFQGVPHWTDCRLVQVGGIVPYPECVLVTLSMFVCLLGVV